MAGSWKKTRGSPQASRWAMRGNCWPDRGWKGWVTGDMVGLNWMAAQRISKGFYWDFGIGFRFYNFKFENRDYQAVRGEDEIEFVQRTDVDGFKSKISSI